MPKDKPIFDIRSGKSNPPKKVARLHPQQKSSRLPACLTWNADLHPGAECVEIVFDADPGGYLIELVLSENHVRRVREGSNLDWDGISRRMAGSEMREYDLQHGAIKRWIEQLESQIEADSPHRADIDFWSIDEFVNQPMPSLFTVELDGREIGVFAEHYPRYTLTGRDEYRKRTIRVPALITTPRSHTLRITPHHTGNPRSPESVWHRYSSAKVRLEQARLSSQSIATPTHPLRDGESRLYPMDFWGWEAPLFYQRFDTNGASLQYLNRVFKECFHRGANYVDIYLTDCNRNVCPGYAGIIPWPEELGIEGREAYQYNGTTDWNAGRLKQLNRSAHRSGLAISWYTHIPHFPNHYEVPSNWMENYARVILSQFSGLTSGRIDDRLDGLLFESAGFAIDVDLLLLNETVWSQNPALFFAESENGASRTTSGLVPGRLSYFTCTGRAREDKDPNITQFDPRWDESDYGFATHFGQLNCRDRKYSALYGDVGQDSIIKQVNDFVRDHGGPDTPFGRASGIEWLGEPPDVTSDEARQTLYAVSGDPVVGALAARMQTYGHGGQYDQAQRCHPSIWYRPRHDDGVDHTDCFLQNNYIRLYVNHGGGCNRLITDVSASAHFDSDAPILKLADALPDTVTDGSLQLSHKEARIIEKGPYRATIEEHVQFVTNETVGTDVQTCGHIDEQRTYRCLSDSPFLHLQIDRRYHGAQPNTATAVSLPGYDLFSQGKQRLDKQSLREDVKYSQAPIVLRDSSGLLPTICLIPRAHRGRKPDFIRWQTDRGLAFWWNNPLRHKLGVGAKELCPVNDREQGLSLELVVLGPLYRERDVSRLVDLWRRSQGKTAHNAWNLPVVKVVELPRGKKLPALVKEGRWWYFRGVQPQGGRDLVKVYLPPKSKARVMRWGYIEGVVRPAPGSQYLVNLSDIAKSKTGAKCRARVNAQTPAMVPAIDFTRPIASVKINGKAWLCFEDKRLYLPKPEGEYRVEVIFGAAKSPRILGTHAVLSDTKWDGTTLRFNAAYPSYTKKLPRSTHFYAAIDTAGRSVRKVTGAQLVGQEKCIMTIKFKRGTVKVDFDAP